MPRLHMEYEVYGDDVNKVCGTEYAFSDLCSTVSVWVWP